jgi:hypothetical protein
VAIDPHKLRPSELCRLLNSTPLGEVISERQLHRHRSRAGLRIGDARHMDLLRYVAWLVSQRHAPRREPEVDPYEAVKERSRARNLALSLAGRDIGELPAAVNPGRKAQAESNFRFFCESYFPLTFHLPWSKDHLKVIARIEQAVLRGELFALAMPRGSGKSTICECACIWAVLYGHREFVCLIGSDEGHAMDMLDAIKMELDGNDTSWRTFRRRCSRSRPSTGSPTAATGNCTRASGRTSAGPRARHTPATTSRRRQSTTASRTVRPTLVTLQ